MKSSPLENIDLIISWEEYETVHLPSIYDDILMKCVYEYRSYDDKAKRQYLDNINDETQIILHIFSYRMSMLSVRKKSPEILLNALIAFCIANEKINDPRLPLTYLVIFYKSAQLLNIEPECVFKDASKISKAYTDILSFLDREERLKSLDCMGWRIEQGPSGLIYWSGPDDAPDYFL